ncbi:HAMP domain-containing protein [Permianibacter sp. IMCC34836]|uniref:adenylate/guanylate cyclase domain-containing protein n=1 Tax=Permianibacter fluminis TaxID=2738515 RepID=UPI00155763C4|nr:adenylate/guanylate cyclase domain-containing protein [Permianibacter fluminis]NQD36557.1 HAMP domain-containing protein [Permianibacter fluminis]
MAQLRQRYLPANPVSAAPVLTLAHKLAFAIGGLMAVMLAATWWLISATVENLLADHAFAYGRHMAELSAGSAAEPLLAEDRLQLSVLLDAFKDDPYIVNAGVYDRYGRVLASTTPLPALPIAQLESLTQTHALPKQASRTIILAEPVKFQEVSAGYLLLTLDRQILEKPLERSLRKIGIASALMITLAMIAAYLLGRTLAQPIDRLALATRALREGRFELLINERRDDEIGVIIGTLNDMAQNLQKRMQTEKTLTRFVSSAVANRLMQGDGGVIEGQHVIATVVFVDMVGFTAMSERLPAQRVAQMLNYYFGVVNRVAKLYHGNVDKYIGDGAMLVFGAPQTDSEHCFHALCFADLLMQLIDQLNARRPSWLPPVAFRLGMHTGDMIAGSMGSEDRMQYTVIGDSVNLAARLCSVAKGGQIILSEEVLSQPDIRNRIAVEPQGNVQLKGKSLETFCYRLHALHSPFQQLIDRQVQHLLEQQPVLPE